MSEGGDTYISPNFAKGLRQLTTDLGIYFIVDEVQTGVCTSGDFWAHDHWNLPSPPDFVTFAKKMQSAGFYSVEELTELTPYRHFNTFLGDPVRGLITATQNKVIAENELSKNAKETGEYLQTALIALESKYPDFIQNVRGRGTFIAYDAKDAASRDALGAALRKQGVNQGGCGTHTARLRPALYFTKKHADIYLDRLEKAI